ncbi:outer membrane protein assembly factor BamB [Acidihalobacter aeolianus]|uniref:Outer membrane protein assembly factor BamB n=1 Tax=Acidihalobacter aeolianus TaxID=2792603 RepID=A0A1D8K7E1_9GAMM|nr:outer membrane protein assembly factor BamB [Acidihalobacter aeolianus]AOV16877.1 outer membrane protein assembly factor BamB [Acidihalobacter aeolianus]
MKGNIRRTLAAALAVAAVTLLGGCSLFEKPVNTRPPTPLKPIKASVPVKEMWSTTLGNGNGGYLLKLKPWVSDQVVYAADQAGKVYALNAKNGNRLWSTNVGQRLSTGVAGGEGRLFVGTQNGSVIALSLKTHQVIWKMQAGSEVMAISPPAQGEVLVHTNAGKLLALDISTGNVIWNQGIESPHLILRSKTTPVISGNTVVTGFSDGQIAAFSLSDGTPKWQLTVAEPHGASELERMVDVSGRIDVIDGVVFAASYHGRVVAATLSKGQLLWSHPMSSFVGLAVGSQAVYISDSHSEIWALDLATGASLWKQSALRFREVTVPVLDHEYVIVGDYQGYLHWLSRRNGAFVARTQVSSSAIDAPPVVVGNDVYVQAADGTVAMYRVGKPTAVGNTAPDNAGASKASSSSLF